MSVASFHRLTAAQPNLSHDPHRHHAHAFEAIAATLPLDSVGYEPQLNAKGEARWCQPLAVDARVLLLRVAAGAAGSARAPHLPLCNGYLTPTRSSQMTHGSSKCPHYAAWRRRWAAAAVAPRCKPSSPSPLPRLGRLALVTGVRSGARSDRTARKICNQCKKA